MFPDAKLYPAIPRNENLFNSPGVHLTYRLPCATSPTIRLIALAIFCLVLNGLVAAVATVVVKGLIGGNTIWLIVVSLIPMTWFAAKTTRHFLSRLSETLRIGPTSIEVSDLPLLPGRRYDICISQAGRVELKSVKVHLACDESATFRNGTDVRNESRRVSLQKVLQCSTDGPRSGHAMVHQAELVMPPKIMHSFQSNSNAVQWKFLVEGTTQAGNAFERVFSSRGLSRPNGR